MLTLTLSFFIVAFLYSIVGFGGGSSYIALLAVAETSYTLIPKISLICNLLVVTSGCYLYYKKGYLKIKQAAPFVISSVPLAFLGGAYPLKEHTFMILLTVSLFLAGLRILFIKDKESATVKAPTTTVSLIVGGLLGLLSGMVGIGGGIFLSPFLLNLRWAKAKEAAATSSAFIFLNSLAGLAGQMTKDVSSFTQIQPYAFLFLAVILGGQIGSRLGTHNKISHLLIQRATGVLILFVSVRLFIKL